MNEHKTGDSAGANELAGGTDMPHNRAALDVNPGDAESHPSLHLAHWLSWMIALAMTAAVIIAALHFSEEWELVNLIQEVQLWWLLVAAVLQSGTYFAQG